MGLPWIIAVDLDGLLAKSVPPEKYADAPPIKENIDKVNKLKDLGHRVIIYTARGWYNYDLTVRWLNKHKVKFDQLVMGKLYSHAYVDDCAYSLDDLLNKLKDSEVNK